MNSLDPRVNRLPQTESGTVDPKITMDQFITFEVFVEPKEGKPYQHEGAVHAPEIEMAFVLAKETFTRRFTCSALAVTDTRHVFVSPTTEGTTNVYNLMPEAVHSNGEPISFEVYHLLKRGKQHVHVGRVMATSSSDALSKAKNQFHSDKIVYNVWVIKTSDIRFTTEEEKELWLTLPEKKFRDAAEYKGGDKLKDYLEKHSH